MMPFFRQLWSYVMDPTPYVLNILILTADNTADWLILRELVGLAIHTVRPVHETAAPITLSVLIAP
jgi:hypothetical protein